jgi:hypothetical protein
MDVEETEAKNNCAGEGQQQFNRPTDRKVAYISYEVPCFIRETNLTLLHRITLHQRSLRSG